MFVSAAIPPSPVSIHQETREHVIDVCCRNAPANQRFTGEMRQRTKLYTGLQSDAPAGTRKRYDALWEIAAIVSVVATGSLKVHLTSHIGIPLLAQDLAVWSSIHHF